MESTMESLLYGLDAVIQPRVVIITMFNLEADAWLCRENPRFHFNRTIKVPGLNPRYPEVHSTENGHVCLLTTGESFINATLALTALINSKRFDLRNTYFLIAGIAGVNPKLGTLGSVTLSRYTVQVDLQYEFDARRIPATWSTGYVAQGATAPLQPPTILYGTEVFEVNDALRQRILKLARSVPLDDNEEAAAYRAGFAGSPGGIYDAATQKPGIMDADGVSSSVFFHGQLLSDAFEEYVRVITNGRGSYGMTNQEDNATLATLLRAALPQERKVDFGRIIMMRAASNFDRPFDESRPPTLPLHTSYSGLNPSLENLYRVGVVAVDDILRNWRTVYRHGIKATNYVGDILGSLGGTPDFGNPPPTGGSAGEGDASTSS